MRRRIGSPDPFELADLVGRVGYGGDVVGRRRGRRCCRSGGPGPPGPRSAGAATPGRRSAVGLLERGGVDHHGVVEARPAARRPRRRAWPGRRAAPERSPRGHGGPAGGQGAREHGGRRALVGRQADVAAREGQPVGLAHDRAPDHLDRAATGRAPGAARRPAAGSPSGRSRPGTGRRWRRAWPPRWPRRRSGPGRDAPSQRVADAARPTPSSTARSGHDGYISRTRRDEDDVGPGLGADEQVALERPRVVRDVLGVAELQRVHEDADRHHVALGAGPRHERAVPVVQRAHGRHQPDHPAGGTGLVRAGRGSRRRSRRRPSRRSYTDRRRHGRDAGTAARRRCAGTPASAVLGQPRGQRRPGLVAGALALGQGVEVAAERGPVAPAGRTGQRGAGAQRGHVVDGGPGRAGRKDSRSSPTEAATRSTWPSRATTWLAAMQAAAW